MQVKDCTNKQFNYKINNHNNFTIFLQLAVAGKQIAYHLHRILGCAWGCGHAIATVSIVVHDP